MCEGAALLPFPALGAALPRPIGSTASSREESSARIGKVGMGQGTRRPPPRRENWNVQPPRRIRGRNPGGGERSERGSAASFLSLCVSLSPEAPGGCLAARRLAHLFAPRPPQLVRWRKSLQLSGAAGPSPVPIGRGRKAEARCRLRGRMSSRAFDSFVAPVGPPCGGQRLLLLLLSPSPIGRARP